MRTYNVYYGWDRGYTTIKQGFSWPGFFFTWLWAMVKGLWGVAAGLLGFWLLLAILLVPGVAQGELPLESASITFNFLGLVVSIIVGVQGNRWRKNKARKLDQKLVAAEVEARSRDSAISQVAGGPDTSQVKVATQSATG